MPATPIEELLNRPIAWKNWQRDRTIRHVLQNLQANIVKGHGRKKTRNIFLNFESADTAKLRSAVRKLARAMPSALDQLQATEVFKLTGESGGTVLCFFLRPNGYAALDAADKAPLEDAAGNPFEDFIEGMKARGGGLADPDVAEWDEGLQGRIDAMLLVADDDDTSLDAAATRWLDLFLAAGATSPATVKGAAIHRKVAGNFEGVEQFGYVDGRSQPLFLAEDVEKEMRSHWDPAFPPSQFLVDDPGDDDPTSLGSFFVFRQLEQDVAGFKAQETALAGALALPAIFEDRAGALIVGRFEDGSPVVLDPLATDMPPVNDFDYRSDELGQRCPFVAHIRKTNPRGESPFHLAKDIPGLPKPATTVRSERSHIMARRGITYGKREYDEATNELVGEPSTGVGLLFMAYMSSIKNQFEFTQATWANNPNFVQAGVGVDPVIAQAPPASVPVTDGWGGTSADFTFDRFVTLKGGEYFFAPALNVLRHI